MFLRILSYYKAKEKDVKINLRHTELLRQKDNNLFHTFTFLYHQHTVTLLDRGEELIFDILNFILRS